MRTRLPLIIAALSAAVVSGCTTSTIGTPLPAPDTGTSSTEAPSDAPPSNSNEDLPSDGAPKVENSLDVTHFEQNPCDALTTAQASELNIPTTGEPKEEATGKGCIWLNRETRGAVFLDFFSSDKRGLSSLYREAEGSDFAYFEPIDDLGGQPAVAYHPNAAEPTTDCAVGVGVTDELMFSTRVDISDANIDRNDPCEVATRVVGMMLETMREAA